MPSIKINADSIKEIKIDDDQTIIELLNKQFIFVHSDWTLVIPEDNNIPDQHLLIEL